MLFTLTYGLTVNTPIYSVYDTCYLQVVELKEAEEKSLKESERLEKEIIEVQEMKVPVNNSIKNQLWSQSVFLFNGLLFSAQKKISTMTADEYFSKHPELKKKFDDEIRNDNWGY